jgi:aspartyl-tRNA(Asn)/glutamyl-tRNA(Gln) amidotransferase subunit A
MNLTELSLSEASTQIAARTLSPVDLTQAYLDRIEELDPRLKAYITISSSQALDAAHQAETDIMTGGVRSPLHGIPIALKDVFETVSVLTTAGTPFCEDYVPEQNSYVAARLQKAGAILLGKLNMHEWAFGVINDNAHYGTTRNPWDMTRSTGGSSGGSGAALAAGMCAGSFGSDTRGSVRIPAALCGVVGLKPTYGRISLRGVLPLSHSLDHVGPMARTVKDCAMLLQATAGYDAKDPLSLDVPTRDYMEVFDGGIEGWRVGVAVDDYFSEASAEVRTLVEQATDVLKDLGAQVREVDMSFMRASRQMSRVILSSDAAALHQERVLNEPDRFAPDVLARLREGLQYTAADYSNARLTQAFLRQQLNALFEQFEILVTPTVPMIAPRFDKVDELNDARANLSAFTAPFNMVGVPAISIPCGFTPTGLPVGLQLVARMWDESRLLRAARAYEAATLWKTQTEL